MKIWLISKVFNLPSFRTISEYNSIGGKNKDDVLYDLLHEIEDDINKFKDEEWVRHVSLKFDACHIAGKNGFQFVSFNLMWIIQNLIYFIGFTHDAFDPDILLEEFKGQANELEDEVTTLKPERSKQFLLFMISNWSPGHAKIKHSIARFSTWDRISSIFFVNEIRNMIVSLNRYRLIVNNVVNDEATGNRSVMRKMATQTIVENIGKNIICTNEQKKYLDFLLKNSIRVSKTKRLFNIYW